MRDTVRDRATVLLVEPPRPDRPGLTGRLDSAGHTVWRAESGSEARQILAEARRARTEPDLIVLERVLPDVDGLVLAAFFRAEAQTPIVLCSDRAVSATDRILGYHVGVDGFVASPPDAHELEALVQSLLRRIPPKQSQLAAESATVQEMKIGSLVVHEKKRSACIDSEPLGLTPTQYRVLATLAQRPDGLVSTADIAQTVWNCDADEGVASLIATQVARLRAKLRDRSATAPSIVSVAGRGYRLLAA